MLESHGLFTWASDAKACYELTLDSINRAIAWFEREIGERARLRRRGGGERLPADSAARLRGAAHAGDPQHCIGADEPKVGHFDDSAAVLEFVGSSASTSSPRSAPPVPTISCAPRSGRS